MKGLIRASINNPHAIVVMALAISVLGALVLGIPGLVSTKIPVDILPVFKSPAVQVLTFYGGMPAEAMEKDITNRMERWTGQANGMKRQESRSIIGASIVRNYFQDDQDPNGALTQVNSLALGVVPVLPPGTLPPVVLPFDPTSTTPVALVALDSQDILDSQGNIKQKAQPEAILYDVARYEVRNFIMQNKGANAPVVIGGKIRAVILELDETKMRAHGLSASQVMNAVDQYNLFFPSGDIKVGFFDYALSSNSMFDVVKRMEDIPITQQNGRYSYLGDVAEAKDSSFIQTNLVRVNGRRQVYIPVYRQVGASTLEVVSKLKETLPSMKDRVTRPNIDLKLVMDQSIYVRASIVSLAQEGIIGALLCSLVILLFLGQVRMTFIAILTLPLSVMVAVAGLYYVGQTINVMTLAGLTLAIGPMIDGAIICLENTHRHLSLGTDTKEAAVIGASEVAMPGLVSTLCTFLVLSPLGLMQGMGRFLFMPMMLAVMFAMTAVYFLSLTLVPCFSAYLLTPHAPGHRENKGAMGRLFVRWEKVLDAGIAVYVRLLNVVMAHKGVTVASAFTLLVIVVATLLPFMRRDFFPEVDSGSFEVAVRAPSGTRIEETEKMVGEVEKNLRQSIGEHDLELLVSEIGLTADWSAAYTPNAGPMDAVVKVQLTEERKRTSQQWIRRLRDEFAKNDVYKTWKLDFSFDSGGLVRGALNEGKSSPISIQLQGKDQKPLFALADQIIEAVRKVPGIVDVRILQRPNYPQFNIEIDRAKAAQFGLTQDDIMKNVIAATNSSITYNKKNFWIDPISSNQYFVGVQYPEAKIQTADDLGNIPITSPRQSTPIPLSNLLVRDKEGKTVRETKVPTEINHVNLLPSVDLTMNVEGRDLGHTSVDVASVLNKYGKKNSDGSWSPYDVESTEHQLLPGSKIILAGEYTRMQDTFFNLGTGLLLASLLIYFLMVALDRSFLVPLAVMLIVPLCLIGVLPMLYFTRSAINVQSLLGVIFVVGIKVANTVLMTDYAQELRRHEGMSPIQAIRMAAALRVRPVTMTALAAFFAMIPTALALEKGSEANAPLARAILGGLIAGEPATLFVLPALYALLIRDKKTAPTSLASEGPPVHHH